MGADLNLLDLLLADLEERLVPDGARFDDLGDAGPKLALCASGLALREAVQEFHVHEDDGRLVEGSDEVLPVGRVDRGLARMHMGALVDAGSRSGDRKLTFPPTLASTMARRVVGICTNGTPRINVAAT